MKKSELKQIIKEEIEAVLVNTKADHYMFFQNLKTIKDEVDELMRMDKDKIEALLSDGHDWASDHIATSKDDVEEVYNFFKTKI
jgi:isopropylmalate/homocitrate/citramalate synthase